MTPSQAIFVIAMTMLGIFAAIGFMSIIAFIYLARHESIEHIDE